ncbi:MAG: hypothetical protein ACXAEU_25180 [Candidatus Hodarchaeales archaeon]|jgi:hypothetical protein
MSDNHYIDVTLLNKGENIPYKIEVNETSYSLVANIGKLLSISFTEGILQFSFDRGQIRLEMGIEDMYKYLKLNEFIRKRSWDR